MTCITMISLITIFCLPISDRNRSAYRTKSFCWHIDVPDYKSEHFIPRNVAKQFKDKTLAFIVPFHNCLAIQLYHFKFIIIPCNKLTTYWLYEDENKLFTNIKHQSSEKKRHAVSHFLKVIHQLCKLRFISRYEVLMINAFRKTLV